MWFGNTEENMHPKKSDSHSGNENNSEVESSKNRYEKRRQSSDDEIEISDESCEGSDGESGKESEKDKTTQSLRETVERLEKIVIEMCANSVKSSNMSEKSRSSARHVRKKHKDNEKRIEHREKENDKKRSVGATTSDSEQTNGKNDENEMDMMCEHAKENAERISENEKKKSRNDE